MRGQSDSLREQFKRLGQLEADNIRLSNIVVQANTPLSEVQLAELQRLREQIELLRRQTNQVQTLRAEIARLRTALSTARNSIAGETPPDVPAEDIYPRDSWTFAGYDTPEATIQSLAWAIGEGDQDTYMAGLAPELRDQMQSDLVGGNFAEEGPFEMGNTSGFRIVDREIISDNQVVYTLYMDGAGDEVPISLVNTNGGWVATP